MRLHDALIEDTYSEAFEVWAARVIVTASDEHWLRIAAQQATGYGTSIIGCDAEAGVERWLDPAQTPDARPGASLLFFARSSPRLTGAVRNRLGQCVLTCPTTAAFDGLHEANTRFDLGKWLSYFGDGHQRRATCFGRDGWCIPVMEGEFFCEARAGEVPAVAGGTLFIGGRDAQHTLAAARAAADAIASVQDVITPFPGGICRCGSKAGSRYANLIASTNDAYCPTLRDKVNSRLPVGVQCLYEIVIDGLSRQAVAAAMRSGIHTAAEAGAQWISSGNYGGRLGQIQFSLHALMAEQAEHNA